MNKVIPFVKRFKELCPRLEGYSTALSSRYDGWGGCMTTTGSIQCYC
nr:MAG TPA: Regulator of ribonuclease activity B [Caudoviricetes sp.]